MYRMLIVVFLLGGLVMTSQGDEGMWLFSNPPKQLLQEKYQITLSDEWMKHLQLASVRLNNGGSGSFVSPHGLLGRRR